MASYITRQAGRTAYRYQRRVEPDLVPWLGEWLRQTLGTAVFSGMLGVTLFGIFLTPVFYYIIQWFSDLTMGVKSAPSPPPA